MPISPKETPALRVRLSERMPSRPCVFGLALQDDSVFADFDLDAQRCVVLVRMSFDGFGCCRLEGRGRAMNADDSARLLELVNANKPQQAGPLLAAYFSELRDLVWEDALRAHQLIR